MDVPAKDKFARGAEKAAEAEREIQKNIDAKEKKRKAEQKAKESAGAMQAGAREYPEPPFPKQHLKKPARKTTSSSRRCTTRRITRAPRS